MLHSNYTVSRNTLADAAGYFFEHRPLQRIVLKILWVMALIIVLLTLLKVAVLGFVLTDLFHMALGLIWMFDWRRILHKMFQFLMKRRIGASQYYGVLISPEGLAWDVGGPAALLPWSKMRLVVECLNGYIVPAGRVRFLWVPKSALNAAQHTQLLSALSAHKTRVVYCAKTCGDQPKK